MSSLRNWEIVLFALNLEGGATRAVHTEDVAVRCFKLAPDAFSWLKHKQYPDKEVVRKDLIRLRMGQYGAVFVKGRAGKAKAIGIGKTADGWELTTAGADWMHSNEPRMRALLGTRTVRMDRQEVLRSLRRLHDSRLFRDYLASEAGFSPPVGELAELFRCRVDADPAVWTKRFETFRVQAQAADQQDLCQFVDSCECAWKHWLATDQAHT